MGRSLLGEKGWGAKGKQAFQAKGTTSVYLVIKEKNRVVVVVYREVEGYKDESGDDGIR